MPCQRSLAVGDDEGQGDECARQRLLRHTKPAMIHHDNIESQILRSFCGSAFKNDYRQKDRAGGQLTHFGRKVQHAGPGARACICSSCLVILHRLVCSTAGLQGAVRAGGLAGCADAGAQFHHRLHDSLICPSQFAHLQPKSACSDKFAGYY